MAVAENGANLDDTPKAGTAEAETTEESRKVTHVAGRAVPTPMRSLGAVLSRDLHSQAEAKVQIYSPKSPMPMATAFVDETVCSILAATANVDAAKCGDEVDSGKGGVAQTLQSCSAEIEVRASIAALLHTFEVELQSRHSLELAAQRRYYERCEVIQQHCATLRLAGKEASATDVCDVSSTGGGSACRLTFSSGSDVSCHNLERLERLCNEVGYSYEEGSDVIRELKAALEASERRHRETASRADFFEERAANLQATLLGIDEAFGTELCKRVCASGSAKWTTSAEESANSERPSIRSPTEVGDNEYIQGSAAIHFLAQSMACQARDEMAALWAELASKVEPSVLLEFRRRYKSVWDAIHEIAAAPLSQEGSEVAADKGLQGTPVIADEPVHSQTQVPKPPSPRNLHEQGQAPPESSPPLLQQPLALRPVRQQSAPMASPMKWAGDAENVKVQLMQPPISCRPVRVQCCSPSPQERQLANEENEDSVPQGSVRRYVEAFEHRNTSVCQVGADTSHREARRSLRDGGIRSTSCPRPIRNPTSTLSPTTAAPRPIVRPALPNSVRPIATQSRTSSQWPRRGSPIPQGRDPTDTASVRDRVSAFESRRGSPPLRG